MYARILVPVDASPTSEAGVAEALRIARACGARVLFVHAVDQLPYLPEAVACEQAPEDVASAAVERGLELLERLREQAREAGVAVDAELVEGLGRRTHAFVLERAADWRADLVVLGTHGRRGIERWIAGSVAEQVVRHADVPVLLVRSPSQEPSGEGLQSIAAAIA